jgi:asparagine N-glycosylation enzyme membrane subunit Stt3
MVERLFPLKKVLGATLLILALVSLTFFFSDFFYGHYSGSEYRTLDPDSLFFLRIFEKTMAQGNVPAYDSYGSFPDRFNFQYPPFHMFILQKTANFLSLIWPGQDPRYLVGWLPPFFGWVLAMILVSFVWAKTRNAVLTLLVSFACVPGIISTIIYQFQRIDYHFLNNFFIWVWIIFAALYCDGRKQWHLIAGVVAALLFQMTWGGTPLFFFIVTVYFVVLLFFRSGILSDFGFYCSSSMVVSSLTILLFLVISGVKTFNLGGLSLLQPLLILSGGIFVVIALWMPSLSGKGRFALLAPILIFAALLFPYFFEKVKDGFIFVSNSDLNLQSINELRAGINFSQILVSFSGIISAVSKLRLVFFLFPFLIFFNPSGLFDGGGKLLKGFSAIFLLMGCFSERYFRWLGILIGFWNGVALFFLFCVISSTVKADDSTLFRKNFKYLFFLPFLLLHFFWSYPMFYKPSSASGAALMSAMNWIRDNTPPTSGFLDNKTPEYGIYNYWHSGNVVNYYAQRPTIVNNTMVGYGKMAEIFCAADEESAYSICEKYGIRYFYINSFYDFSDRLVRFMRAYYLRPGVTGTEYLFFPDYIDNPEDSFMFDKTFHYWLRNKLAIEPSGMFSEAASRLRIVYCDEYHSANMLPTYLLYELVRGAVVKGNADAGSEVEVALDCRFADVETRYRRKVKVSDQGDFSIRLPYANSWKNGNVETGSAYQISVFIDGKMSERSFSLSENDVAAGNEIKL